MKKNISICFWVEAEARKRRKRDAMIAVTMNQGDQGEDRSEECLMMKNLNFLNNLPYLTLANRIRQSARGTKKNRRIKSAEGSEEPPVKIMHPNTPHQRMRMTLHQRLVEVNGDRKRNP